MRLPRQMQPEQTPPRRGADREHRARSPVTTEKRPDARRPHEPAGKILLAALFPLLVIIGTVVLLVA